MALLSEISLRIEIACAKALVLLQSHSCFECQSSRISSRVSMTPGILISWCQQEACMSRFVVESSPFFGAAPSDMCPVLLSG